jgi:hypothetical protein
MQGEENRYKPFFERTVLECHKYAIFHHQMMKKQGNEIDAFDMEYGLLVSRYHLCSFARYLQLRMKKNQTVVNELEKRLESREYSLQDRMKVYVQTHPEANLRTIYRALNIKKAKAEELLAELGITLQVS